LALAVPLSRFTPRVGVAELGMFGIYLGGAFGFASGFCPSSFRQRQHFTPARFGGFAAPASFRGAALHFAGGHFATALITYPSLPILSFAVVIFFIERFGYWPHSL